MTDDQGPVKNEEYFFVFTGYCKWCKSNKLRIKRGKWEFRWCETCDGSAR